MHTRKAMLIAALGLAFGLAGCGGGDNDDGGGDNDAGGATSTDFTSFVKDELATPSDTRAPAAVNERDFEFSDRENPDAYDDVL